MITLYTFGPNFGLPDPSPFVMKAEMLLKLAKLAYATDSNGFRQAPKGKLPYIRDGGMIVADSTFIRQHLETKHSVDFDRGLTAEQRGLAWATERMCEEHLYWVIVHDRWMVDENFDKGPAVFFSVAPRPIRPLMKRMIRGKLRSTLRRQGFGRHSPDEIAELAKRDIDAIATILGTRPYLFGNVACGADACIFAFLAHALCAHFDTPMRKAAEAHVNLVAYRDRMMTEYFPAFATAA